MATSTQVSLGEYMSTSYRPDREYIDGELRERNVGKWEPHGFRRCWPLGLESMRVFGRSWPQPSVGCELQPPAPVFRT